MSGWSHISDTLKGVAVALAVVVVAMVMIGCDMLSGGSSDNSESVGNGGATQTVFAAGHAMNSSGVPVPVYWENGNLQELSKLSSAHDGKAIDVVVSDGDIHVVGYTVELREVGYSGDIPIVE